MIHCFHFSLPIPRKIMHSLIFYKGIKIKKNPLFDVLYSFFKSSLLLCILIGLYSVGNSSLSSPVLGSALFDFKRVTVMLYFHCSPHSFHPAVWLLYTRCDLLQHVHAELSEAHLSRRQSWGTSLHLSFSLCNFAALIMLLCMTDIPLAKKVAN